MDFKTYQELAARTESEYFFYDSFKTSTIHGIIGIQTEATELLQAFKGTIVNGDLPDLVNVREEIGDLLWYISIVTRSEGFFKKWNPIYNKDLYKTDKDGIELIIEIQISAGFLIDIVKKGLFYARGANREVIEHNIGNILLCIKGVCELCEWNLDEIMQENIDKLKKRYPEKFTTEHSEIRLDKE